ncbi:MAG: hypothetical protein ABR595_08415 [Psychroflexus sp.]
MRKTVFISFLFCFAAVLAQNKDEVDSVLVDQYSFEHSVEFDPEIIQDFKNDSDYNYYRAVGEKSITQEIMNWINMQFTKFIEWLFGDMVGASFWEYLGLILKIVSILGLVFLVVWLLNRYNPGQKLTKNSKNPEVNLTEEEELIYQKNLQDLIQEAIQNNDYRLAIRYYYLLILKNLKNKNILEYQFQKTNTEYIQEVKNQSFSEDFEAITKYYDFVWYGDFQLNNLSFEKLKSRFENLNKIVKQQPKHE